MTTSAAAHDTLMNERLDRSSDGGLRADFLARRWAEYRYPDTLVAHLAGHASLQAGALLLADGLSVGGVRASWLLAAGLCAAGTWIHPLPGLMMGSVVAAVLAAGHALRSAAPTSALWPFTVPALFCFVGLVLLCTARRVYQDMPARHAWAARASWREWLAGIATGGALHLFFLLVRRGLWPDVRQQLTERAVLRFASGQGRPWRNWARTADWHAARVWFPTTAADLVEIVQLARREGRRIRVVGSAYSWEPLAATEDFLVCQCLMRDVGLDLSDPSRPRATVQAGANGRELNRLLEPRGYAVPSNVVMETVSWGGMISVGAHGSGWEQGTLSDMVEVVELVDGRGRLRRFERGVDSDDVLDTVRVALGLCGIIHLVTLRVVPRSNVAMKEELRPIGDVLDTLRREVLAHEYFDVYWFPFAKNAWTRAWDKTSLPRSPVARQKIFDQHSNRTHAGLWLGVVQMSIGMPLDWLMARFPSWTPAICRFKNAFFTARSRVCDIDEATHFRSSIELYRVGCAEVAFAVDPAFDSVRRAWRIVDDAMGAGPPPGSSRST